MKETELAKRWVVPPHKVGNAWFVSWLSGARIDYVSFTEADDAYNFYYCKIKQLTQRLKEYK